MDTRLSSTAALVALHLAAVLFANPLYLHSPPDRGDVFLDVERTPLIRLGLTGLGVLAVAVAVVFEWRARQE